jgi:hypothetical protein
MSGWPQGNRKGRKAALRYRFVLDSFQKHLGSKAQKPLAAVTPRDYRRFSTNGCSLAPHRKPSCGPQDTEQLPATHSSIVILHNPVPATETRGGVVRTTLIAGQVGLLVATLDAD